MNNCQNNILKKVVCAFFCCLLICCTVIMTGCIAPKQNIELADVNVTFEKDYPLLRQVTTYMLQLIDEQELHMIIINNSNDPITINYGDKLAIEDAEFKQAIKNLFDQGYMRISFNKNTPQDETVICFERWKKPGEYEYRSGYAYSPNAKGELNIQYIISQEDLSVPGWYYYEEDYNEWRSRKN